MRIRQLLATVKGIPIWIFLEGSGDPTEEHVITGIDINNVLLTGNTAKVDEIDDKHFVVLE